MAIQRLFALPNCWDLPIFEMRHVTRECLVENTLAMFFLAHMWIISWFPKLGFASPKGFGTQACHHLYVSKNYFSSARLECLQLMFVWSFWIQTCFVWAGVIYALCFFYYYFYPCYFVNRPPESCKQKFNFFLKLRAAEIPNSLHMGICVRRHYSHE